MSAPHADAVRLAEAVATALHVEAWERYEQVRADRAIRVERVLRNLDVYGLDSTLAALARIASDDVGATR